MNKVSRALFRALLRWNRQPELINNPFVVIPSALGIDRMLPPGVQTLKGIEGVQAAMFHCFRNQPYSSQNCDLALSVLKKLNDLSASLKQRLQQQTINADQQLQKYVKFRVGQVILHSKTNVRGVVAGWTVDVAQKKQMVRFLPDLADFNEFIKSTGELATFLDAVDCKAVKSRMMRRIHNVETDNYFSHFDIAVGRYVPLEDLTFLYPLDVLDVPYSKQLLSSEGTHAAKRMLKRVEALSAAMQRLVDSRFPGLWGQFSSGELFHSVDAHEDHRNDIARQILVEVMRELRDLLPTPPSAPSPDFARSLNRGGDLWAAGGTAIISSLEALRDVHSTIPLESKNVFVTISHLASGVSTVDQLLQLRFQSRGLAFADTLALDPPVDCRSVMHGDNVADSSELTQPRGIVRRELEPLVGRTMARSTEPAVVFTVGQVVKHKVYGYRGAVLGHDIRPTVDASSWEAVHSISLGQEQPFYKIIPDEKDVQNWLGPGARRSHFYVAQQNLVAVTEPSQKVIGHRNLGRFFLGYDVEKGRFRAPHQLRYCFPLALPADYPRTSLRQHWAAQRPQTADEIQTAEYTALVEEAGVHEDMDMLLLQLRDLLRGFLSELVRPGADDSQQRDLLTLLREAPSNLAAMHIETLQWYANVLSPVVDASVCMRLGIAELKRNNSNAAQRTFAHAVLVDPSFAEARNKLAALNQQLGNYQACVEQAKEALKIAPHHYGAHLGLGLAYDKLGKLPKAIAELKTVLRIHPWATNVSTILLTMERDRRQTEAVPGPLEEPPSSPNANPAAESP